MTALPNKWLQNKWLQTGLLAAVALTGTLHAATPACDPDNGGIKLPTGFCAFLAVDGIGSARHLAVAPNGDVYVALLGRRGPNGTVLGGGVVGLHDPDGSGHFTVKESFGTGSSTGIGLRNGYLYVATTETVDRYKMTPGQLKPSGPMEPVVVDLPKQNEHEDKGLTFDGKGGLYINIGAPSNACQKQDRRPKVAGQDPCPILEEHGGIWKFDENKLNQKLSDGVKFATGLRQMPAIAWHDGAVYIAMNSRDQLDTLWGEAFTAQENAERPAEPLYRAEQGDNFGWPFCFFDYGQQKLLLNPEYGGDGKQQGRCASGFKLPIASFPAHWAPLDIMFYDGKQFPAHYQGGAFIAFHGSWNRSPMPQEGYNVSFQPFSGGKPSAKFEEFATGFTGVAELKNPGAAAARADGVAQGPDGSLYITDSVKGKIWRVMIKK
jgi:glucose/arabinose dehydrogenase